MSLPTWGVQGPALGTIYPQPPPPGVWLCPGLAHALHCCPLPWLLTLGSCPVMAVPTSTPSRASLPSSLWGVCPRCPERTWSQVLAWALVPVPNCPMWGVGGVGPWLPIWTVNRWARPCVSSPWPHPGTGCCRRGPALSHRLPYGPAWLGGEARRYRGVHPSKGWQHECARHGAHCACLLTTCPVLTGQLAACAYT